METKQHTTEQSMGKQRNKRDQEYLETWNHNFPKSMRHSKSSSKKEVHSDIDLPQETRKI